MAADLVLMLEVHGLDSVPIDLVELYWVPYTVVGPPTRCQSHVESVIRGVLSYGGVLVVVVVQPRTSWRISAACCVVGRSASSST